jgi:hypothetical protein
MITLHIEIHMNWVEFTNSLQLDQEYLNTCLWLEFIKWENKKSVLNCPLYDLCNKSVFGQLESEDCFILERD